MKKLHAKILKEAFFGTLGIVALFYANSRYQYDKAHASQTYEEGKLEVTLHKEPVKGIQLKFGDYKANNCDSTVFSLYAKKYEFKPTQQYLNCGFK